MGKVQRGLNNLTLTLNPMETMMQKRVEVCEDYFYKLIVALSLNSSVFSELKTSQTLRKKYCGRVPPP